MGHLKPKDPTLIDLFSVRIEGTRVALIPVSRDYAQDIFKEFTPAITRYMMPKPVDNIEQIYAYIDTSREKIAFGNELILAITTITDGEFLGVCGLHGKEQSDALELGLWIKLQAQGKGLGSETMRALSAWARSNLRFSYLMYPVDKRNLPSRRIAESLGGIAIKEGLQKASSGTTLYEVVYRIEP